MIEYKLIRSNRKTISIIIRKDAEVEVRAPLKMKLSEIEDFVLSKQNWINKNTVKLRNLPACAPLSYGSLLPIFGFEKEIVPADSSFASIDGDKILIPQSQDIKSCVLSLLKKSASDYIPRRTAEIAEEMNLKYSSVLINRATTHWGSCTADRLHFSCYLMLADKETVDYVIAHELAHTVHHNHSNKFWNEVQKYCPDYNLHRQKLKSLGYIANSLK